MRLVPPDPPALDCLDSCCAVVGESLLQMEKTFS